MIVDSALYRDGRIAPAPEDLTDAVAQARATDDAFLWVTMAEPTAEEIDHVASYFALHPLAASDALHPHHRPKMQVYSDVLATVVQPLAYDRSGSTVSASELMVFVGDSFVVTVRHGETSASSDLRSRLEGTPEVLRHGPVAILYAVCDSVVDDYLDIAFSLQVDLEELEAQVFSTARVDSAGVTEAIYSFKRQVSEFRRATSPLTAPMSRLAADEVPFVPPHAKTYFQHAAERLARADALAANLDGLLSDILTAHLTQVGVRQNDDMRKISAWAAMAAVPTLIAGVYGMNFDHMPELHLLWGYPAAIGLMALVVLGLYVLFKRRQWL